nr:exopolygalacturonase [Quercus suber]
MGKNLSIAIISLLLVLASTKAQQVFDVKSYGAQPNADITQALTKAWKAACAVAGSKVVILAGVEKLGLVTLFGPCKGAIEFNLQGTPSDVASFNDSPNTNGIHMGRSSQITIANANIGTGDDCISVGDGAQDITINQVTCGLGHGISIGSLGRYENEGPVSGIRVTGVTLSNTKNGVRIKTWPASTSRVASNIHFEDVVMNNVANSVLIDQNYSPNSQCSNESPSIVKISNVSFKKIRGTSSIKEAVNLICSKSVTCQQVVLSDIDLAYKEGRGSTTSTCANVQPAVSGKQKPPACTSKH